MIVIDIETTGVDPRENCMVSLGAIDYETGKEFYQECQIWGDAKIEPIALQINGFTEDEIRDERKPFPQETFLHFVNWCVINEFDMLLGGHNVGHFDVLFLEDVCKDVSEDIRIKWPFGYRTVDLHSIAYAKFLESLSHEKICEKLGLPSEGTPHNALVGAKSECEAFKILLSEPFQLIKR